MATIKQFTSLASGQSGIGIYVLGGQGELLKDIDSAWIKRKEDSESNYKKAYEMYLKRKDIKGARAFDCSGLVCWALVECGAKPKGFDTTANGLYKSYTTAISKHDLRDGDLCFKVKDGKAHHVGIYVNGKIVEAKGRAYGVVSSSVSSSWNAFGRLNIKWDDEPQGYVFTRNLKKGMKGEDVKELQKLLMKKGYALPKYGADGSLGSETDRAIRRFQVDHSGKPYYLKVDGIAGKNTITALGGQWK